MTKGNTINFSKNDITNVSTYSLFPMNLNQTSPNAASGENNFRSSLIKKDSLVIFGSGASKAVDDNLPLDADFLSKKADIIEKEKVFLFEALKTLYHDFWKEESLENAWSEIDNNFNNPKVILKTKQEAWIYQKLEELSKMQGYYKYYWDEKHRWSPEQLLFILAGWQLRTLIFDTFKNCKNDSELHLNLFKVINNDFSIISFNYDLIAEDALKNSGKDFYYPIVQNDHPDTITVLKPHGSVNWRHKINHNTGLDVISYDGNLSNENMGIENKILIQPSIIGLVRNKREFTFVEKSIAVNYIYKNTLALVKKAIKVAKKIIIIGYSFPPGDGHIIKIFKEAKNETDGEKEDIKKIYYCIKNEEISVENYKDNIKELFNVEDKNIMIYPKGFCQDFINIINL